MALDAKQRPLPSIGRDQLYILRTPVRSSLMASHRAGIAVSVFYVRTLILLPHLQIRILSILELRGRCVACTPAGADGLA